MTNRTPQEIVKAALERWDEYSHTPSSRLTSMDWEMLEESFLKGIQAALEADRNARVLVVPDRDAFDQWCYKQSLVFGGNTGYLICQEMKRAYDYLWNRKRTISEDVLREVEEALESFGNLSPEIEHRDDNAKYLGFTKVDDRVAMKLCGALKALRDTVGGEW